MTQDWTNKKIAWYGTSIPAGYPNQSNQQDYGYPNMVAELLGATCYNYCVSAGQIRENDSTGSNPVFHTQSFTNTQYITNTNYLSKIVNLIGTADEPDLFVFDYGVNDYVHDPLDIDNVAGYDFTSEDTNTFLGSYNKVLKELFTAKPTAKVMLVTHYSDDGVQVPALQNGKNCWKTLNDLIVKIAEYWNVPILDLRNISGMHKTNGVENISVYCPDLIHPASDTNAVAVKNIANICTRFILNNIPAEMVASSPNPNPTPSPTAGCGIGEYNEASPHYEMPTGVVNVWGHSFRFCGTTGGYTDGVEYFDVNGSVTSKALAFPDGLVCDLKYVTETGDFIMLQSNMNLAGNVIYSDALSFCTNFSIGSFNSGWQPISRKEFDQFALYQDVSYVFGYPPFDNTIQSAYWTRDALFFAGDYTRKWRIDQYQGVAFSLENTQAARPFPSRVTNISEL